MSNLLTKREVKQLNKLREMKKLIKQVINLAGKDFKSIIYFEVIHATTHIDELIKMIRKTNLYKWEYIKGVSND